MYEPVKQQSSFITMDMEFFPDPHSSINIKLKGVIMDPLTPNVVVLNPGQKVRVKIKPKDALGKPSKFQINSLRLEGFNPDLAFVEVIDAELLELDVTGIAEAGMTTGNFVFDGDAEDAEKIIKVPLTIVCSSWETNSADLEIGEIQNPPAVVSEPPVLNDGGVVNGPTENPSGPGNNNESDEQL